MWRLRAYRWLDAFMRLISVTWLWDKRHLARLGGAREEVGLKPQLLWCIQRNVHRRDVTCPSFHTGLRFSWQCQWNSLHLLSRAHRHGRTFDFSNLSGEIPIRERESCYALDASPPGERINEQIRSISIRLTWNNCLFVTINFRALTQDPLIFILDFPSLHTWKPAH